MGWSQQSLLTQLMWCSEWLCDMERSWQPSLEWPRRQLEHWWPFMKVGITVNPAEWKVGWCSSLSDCCDERCPGKGSPFPKSWHNGVNGHWLWQWLLCWGCSGIIEVEVLNAEHSARPGALNWGTVWCIQLLCSPLTCSWGGWGGVWCQHA